MHTHYSQIATMNQGPRISFKLIILRVEINKSGMRTSFKNFGRKEKKSGQKKKKHLNGFQLLFSYIYLILAFLFL